MKCDLEEHQHPSPHPSQSWVCASSPAGWAKAMVTTAQPHWANVVLLWHLTWISWQVHTITHLLFPYSPVRPLEFNYCQNNEKTESQRPERETGRDCWNKDHLHLYTLWFLWLLSKARFETTLQSDPFMFSLPHWCLNMMKEKKNQKGEAIRVEGNLLLRTTVENFQLHVTVLKPDKIFSWTFWLTLFPSPPTAFIQI